MRKIQDRNQILLLKNNNLILGSMIPLSLFFFLKITVAIWGLLWFHKNFWNICSCTVKCAIGMLIGIALNL